MRTAIYEYLIAKRNNGKFILRIEDTDQGRFVDGAIEVIHDTLQSVGIEFDEGPGKDGGYGPYTQSERKPIYKEYADKLVVAGGAYYCFCSKERLDELRGACEARGQIYRYDGCCKSVLPDEALSRIASGHSYVVRQVIPVGGQTTFDDIVYGHIVVDNSELEEGILLKADGMPTYNFANVVDDYLMRITHVIRGSEYLSSTPKYNLLYSAFGWDIPTYIHLPPIMKTKEKKLSKREGDASFEDFVAQGFLKEAIVNYIVLLGWNPGTEQEFFTLSELERCFDINGLSKSPAILDVTKMRWMNSEYIKRLSDEEYLNYTRSYFLAAGLKCFDLLKLSALLKPRTEVFSDVSEKITFLVNLPEYDSELFVHKKMKTDCTSSKIVLDKIKRALQSLTLWTAETVNAVLSGIIDELAVKNSQVLWPLRTALSGLPSSPGGAVELAELLGKAETLRRIDVALAKL